MFGTSNDCSLYLKNWERLAKKLECFWESLFHQNQNGLNPDDQNRLIRKKDLKMKHLLQCFKHLMTIEFIQKEAKTCKKIRKIIGQSFAPNLEGVDPRQ